MDVILTRFSDGLKSPSEEFRLSTVSDLRKYIGSELKEISSHDYAIFIDELCSELECMLSGNDLNEKWGAILAIGCLAEVDFVSIYAYLPSFTSLVYNLTETSDLNLLILGARLLGQFGLLFPNDFVEEHIKRACNSIKRGNISNSQKEFNLLTVREIAIYTPTSFYQQIGQFLPVVLSCFREKEVIVRDLAALALRNALGITAGNESTKQNISDLGDGYQNSNSGQNLIISKSTTNSFARSYNRPNSSSFSLSTNRKLSSIQTPPVAQVQLLMDVPPMSWYHNCLVAMLFNYNDAVSMKPSDKDTTINYSPNYRKMTRDEWSHGSLLILNELLVCVNTDYEKLRSSLDTMLGQPIFHMLMVNQTEGELVVQTVHKMQWAPAVGTSTSSGTINSREVPAHLMGQGCTSDGLRVFGDEGIASELMRQQQFRQQRAVETVSDACSYLLKDNLDRIWSLVLGCLNSKHPGVLHLLFKILPRLVSFSRSFVNKNSIQTLVTFLFDCVNRDRERAYALITLGLMTHALNTEFEADGYLAQLIAILHAQFLSTAKDSATKKRSHSVSTAVLLTIGLITSALGSRVCSSLRPLIEPMMSRGLSQPMTITCSLIATHIPDLKRDVQDSLLKLIDMVLNSNAVTGTTTGTLAQSTTVAPTVLNVCTTQPSVSGRFSLAGTSAIRVSSAFSPSRFVSSRLSFPSSPSSGGGLFTRTSTVTLPGFPWSEALGTTIKGIPITSTSSTNPLDPLDPFLNPNAHTNDNALVVIALRTLGSFDFEGHTLAHFVKHIADNFISINTCGVKDIRLEAVPTCLRLMLHWIKSTEQGPPTLKKTLDAMSNILGKILIVGTSDPDPDVRKCVFNSLDCQFDNYLAQSSHLNTLFIALNDEVYGIRCLIMQCLGRLSDINPACVQPTLRKVLLRNLIDLADSGSSRNKEESSGLLAILLATAPQFMMPYAEPLLHILIPQLRNSLPIKLRMRLLAIRNARLQRAVGRLENADVFDFHDASLSTALLASQSAAYAAAQAVQAVSTATARGAGVVIDRSKLAGESKAIANRAAAAATHAAETASIAAKVIAAAVGNKHSMSNNLSIDDRFNNQHHTLGFPSAPRGIYSGLDLLIGEPDETLPGTNQGFLSLAGGSELVCNPLMPGGAANAHGSIASGPDDMLGDGLLLLLCKNEPMRDGVRIRPGAEIVGGVIENSQSVWREPTPVVVGFVSLLGHLSSVCPYSIVPLMDDLIPILAYMLQDTTCYAKRSVAIWALGVLITNTGFVVLPYLTYPDLLQLLFTLLKREESKSIQAEIVRTLGLIGAVDPFKLKIAVGVIDSVQDTGVAVSQHDIVESRDTGIVHPDLLVNMFWESMDEFFAAYSLFALVNILKEPTLQAHCDKIILAIVYVMDSFKQRQITGLHSIMQELFKCLNSLRDARLQETILLHLSRIIPIIGMHAKEFVHDIVSIIVSHWWISPAVQRNAIRLLSAVSLVLGTDFRPQMYRVAPTLLRTLKKETNEENIIALCDLLGELGTVVDEHIHIFLPALNHLIGNTDEMSLNLLQRSAVQQKATPSQVPMIIQSTSSASITIPDYAGANAAAASSCSPESVELMVTSAASPPDPSTFDIQEGTPVELIDPLTGNPRISGPINPLLRGAIGGPGISQRATSANNIVGSIYLRQAVLRCFIRLTECLPLESHATAIIHPICRLLMLLQEKQSRMPPISQGASSYLSGGNKQVKGKPSGLQISLQALFVPCMEVITNLLLRMGSNFKLILPLVQVMMNAVKIKYPRFDAMLSKVLTESDTTPLAGSGFSSEKPSSIGQHEIIRKPELERLVSKPHTMNSLNLEKAYHSARVVSSEDWNQWLRTLGNTLLRESPNAAIRACVRLVGVAPVITRTLFNAAFMSCWPELTDSQQDDLIATLQSLLQLSNQTSSEISQVILNLEEFMAHVDKCTSSPAPHLNLPLSLNLLADRAMQNRAYAKALRYKELEFLNEIEKRSSPSPSMLSSLLAIYDKLQLSEASTGVLLYATRDPRTKLTDEELWYEKLREWDRAIALCDRKLEDERIKDKTKPILCRIRCLHSLGQWAQLDSMAWDRWSGTSEPVKRLMAPLAARAAITIGAWDRAEKYVDIMPENDHEGGFYRAIIDLHKGNYADALTKVAKSRAILAADLNPVSSEGYARAYPDLVGAQLLSEVEEVIQYKLVPERRAVLHEAWHKRLIGCQSIVEDWGRVIQLRRLVLDPQENIKSCLRYAGLCRRSGRLSLSQQVILNMMKSDPNDIPVTEPIVGPEPAIIFSYTKLLWATGAKEVAFTRLRVLRDAVLEPMLLQAGSGYLDTSAANGQPSQVWPDMYATGQIDVTAGLNKIEDLRKLMSKCCLKLGNWYAELYLRAADASVLASSSSNKFTTSMTNHGQLPRVQSASVIGDSAQSNDALSKCGGEGDLNLLNEKTILSHSFVIQCYRIATEHTPGNRFAWQAWAMANYDLFTRLGVERAQLEHRETELRQAIPPSMEESIRRATGDQNDSQAPASALQSTLAALVSRRNVLQRSMEQLAAPSVRGYINSISISSEANLQDSLRLINLLFQFGHIAEIREIIREGLGKIRLQNWLVVLQQLLARIDTPHEHVANIIVDLLVAVGRQFPQALIYSLVLAFKSGGSDRRRYYATKILYSMEEHSPRLVLEAFLLNEELIRISITWVEMWSECLEDASRVYFTEKDIGKMFRLLHPLHLVMERGHKTINEAAFLQEFGTELTTCRFYCERYEQQGAKPDLQQAWEGYYTLYRNFSKRVTSMTTLELTVSAPRLQAYGKDWVLAVPGSYKPQRPLIRLAGIKNCLMLMTSKQHPRKLSVVGSNGKNYMFLLKGHEDTRQDERIMQFFGLVNTLLMTNQETLRRNLTIQRFSIIPLSTNTGLIGWVPNSDTLHSLIRDYRDKNGIMLNKEHREMLQQAPDFDRLNLTQKTEVFEAGLLESSGRDLANILWLKSHNSEVWFERRTTFIRSIAVMSMVGYILGLGDRHPSNLMLCRETGKVVHIDFGDCFEVAMMREKFPEKVPFRLTRMIIAAMEVTGIDGVYRHTCENVMQLMRDNRDSLLAVLEAFIHDPLLQWVLLENKKSVFGPPQTPNTTVAAMVTAPSAANTQTAQTKLVQQQKQRSAAAYQQQQTRLSSQKQQPGQTSSRQPQGPFISGQPLLPTSVGNRRGPMPAINSGAATGGGFSRASSNSVIGPQSGSGAYSRNAPRVFTDPNYPSSFSLRDCYKVNSWRHHLCNGPWFGCYEIAKTMRKQTDSGSIVCERIGLQGFIFSAKPPVEDEFCDDSQNSFGNQRAIDVLTRIRRKLDGNESGGQAVPLGQQVDDLIREATSSRNVCQMYIGWCAFW